MYIIILNPNHRNPEIWTDAQGFIETYPTVEAAELVGEQLIEAGDCREYQIYEQQ